ncbi:hypothetical protein BDV11DRAFT_186556 [Aspergillus similis]
MLNALAARLDDEVPAVRHTAVKALLREQKEFYCELLEDPLVISLYKVLLELSFKEQFSWYIDDSDCYINTPEGTRRIFVSIQTASVEDIVTHGATPGSIQKPLSGRNQTSGCTL